MEGAPGSRFLKGFRPCRGPTGAALRRCSSRSPRWTTPALAARCSTRNLPRPCCQDDDDLDKLVALVRGYFRLDGHHIQFNVVDAATLRAAKQDPDQYRSLIVRVAGYSDYFCNLSEALQDEIIARTEHQSFG